ncbi:MAG: CarD family transcriptional regulator, partial [Terriglobales bacterium]
MLLPFVREIFADVQHLPAFRRAASHLRESTGRIRVTGLSPAAKALILALLQQRGERPLIVVVPDNRAAEDLLPVLSAFAELTGAVDPDAIVSLPARDVLAFQNLSPHPEIQEERATALWKIATGRASIVISPVSATAILLRAPEYYADLARLLRRGETFDLDKLLQHLNTIGYTSADVVEMPGQYATRGGILDVYSPESDRPVRVEFFGDEIESMRKFDPASQRSSNAVDEVVLLPLTETPVTEELLGAVNARLSGKRIAGTAEAIEQAARDSGAGVFPGWEFYAPVAGADRTVFSMLPEARVILDEPESLTQELQKIWGRIEEAHERSGVGNLVRPSDLYLTPESWREAVAKLPGADFEYLAITRPSDAHVETAALGSPDGDGDPQTSPPVILSEAETKRSEVSAQSKDPYPQQNSGVEHNSGPEAAFLSQPATRFHGNVPSMIEEVKKLTSNGNRVILAAPNTGEVERLADIFTEYNASYRLGSRTRSGESYADETAYFAGEIFTTTLLKAYIPDGFILPEANLAVFGARDLFDESDLVASRPGRQKSKVSAFLSDFRDLQVGDYVVHVEHGIGQYQGLKEINQGDGAAEFMLLEYAEAARLYVPLTRLDLVQKYRSQEGVKPTLNRLGTGQWEKTKARVKKAMKDMTDELLKLYAQRQSAQGHVFPADTEWMKEFEDAFEYNETEDQAQAIADVKRDMEGQLPMDRLLCGDVGYGKTEVAMRAAFKAVQDSKQVAVLTPTTVLAFQHF